MAVGTAFIQVIPDLKGFHRQARQDLKRENITADVGLTPQVDARAARSETQKAAKHVGRVTVTMTPDIDAGRAQSQASTVAGQLRRSVRFDVGLQGGAAVAHANTMAAGLRRNVPFAVDLQALSAAAEANGTAVALGRSVPFRVDLDVGAARTQATVAAASMRRTVTFSVDVDRDMLGSATGAVAAGGESMARSGAQAGMSFGRVGMIIALLGPLIVAAVGLAAAAIMSLPALIMAVAIPIAAIMLGMDGIKRAAAEVAPAFAPIKAAVSGTFYEVMLPVFQQLTVLVPILQSGLVGTAQALGGMAAALTGVVTSAAGMAWLQQIFAGVNMLISGMAPVMATLTAAFLQLAAAGIGPLATGLIAAVGQFAMLFQQMIQQTAASGLLGAAITLFTQTLGVLLQVLVPLLFHGMQMLVIFGPAMNQAFLALIPVLGPLLQLFAILTMVFFQLFAALLPVVGVLLVALMPTFQILGAVIGWVAFLVSGVLVVALQWLTPLLWLLAPVIAGIVIAWMAWHAAIWLTNIAMSVFRLWQAATVAWTLITVGVMWAWVAVQWALNLALSMNPIAWVVIALVALVAVVIYAWYNFGWFRDIVIGAWAGIVAATSWAWSIIAIVFNAIWFAIQRVGHFFTWLWIAAILPAWQGIVAAFWWAWSVISAVLAWIGFAVRILMAIVVTALVFPWIVAWNLVTGAAMWAWNAVLAPVFAWIGGIINWLWSAVVAPIFSWIAGAWRVMASVIMAVFHGILAVTWNAAAAMANWLWSVLSTVFGAIGAGWNALLSGMNWVWQNVLRPCWDAIQGAASWMWRNVLAPTFGAIGAGWNGLMQLFRFLWESVLRPTWGALQAAAVWMWTRVLAPTFGAIGAGWNALMNGIRVMYDAVLVPTFNAMKAAVHAVGQAFLAAVRWIGDIWSTIKGLLAKPVNFMINVVYNGGIKAAWDKVAGWLKLPALPGMAPIPEFAKGGQVPGSGNRDTVPAWLTPGEFVLSKPAVAAMGGAGAVDSAHRGATSPAQPAPGMGAGPGGAGGNGHTWPELKKIGEDLGGRFTSGYRPGASGYHGKGQAVDLVAGDMAALAGRIGGKFPNATQIISSQWRGGTGILNGSPYFYAKDNPNHVDHVHWAMTPRALGGATGVGGGVGGSYSIPNPIAEMLHGMKHFITNPVRGGIGAGIDALVPGAGEPGTWKSGAKGGTFKIFDAIVDWVDRKVDEMFPAIEVFGGGGGGGGNVEQWRGVALQALQMTGQPASMVDALLRRMGQESGGNPRAINLWDSNAKKGTPSMGLLQTIMPTFQRYKMPGHDNIWNPLDNILASIRYTVARYGSLPAGYNRAGGYDSGGWLPPGLSLAYNGTGQPEAVMTADQFAAIESYANQGTGTTINVNAPQPNASPQRIAASIDRHLTMYGRI